MKTQLIVAAILWLATSNTVWSTEEEHNKNEIDFSIKTSACQSFSLRPHNLVDGAAVAYFYLSETPAGRIGDGLPPPCGGDKAAATTFSIRITARRGQQVTIICPRGCNVDIDCSEDSGGGRNDSFCKMIVYFLSYIALLLMLLVAITGSHCLHERRGARHCREADASEIPISKTSEEKPTLKNESFNKDKSTNEDKPASENESTLENELNPENETVSENKPAAAPAQQFDSSRSSISLLDRFRVRGSDGSDITASFSPLLRKILVALILHSVKSDKGISVKDFTDMFWFDKTDDDARNNRNVLISNLRKRLQLVGDVQIVCKDSYLRILFGSSVKCDYHRMAKLMRQYEACGDDDGALMTRITELLYRGPLLTEMSLEWLDSFKDSYSSKSLDLLLQMLQSGTGGVSESDITRLASVMFMHDPLSEKALAACCAMLIKHDKRSIAKNVFDRFCCDYYDSMGEPFGVPFSSLIDN